MEPREEDGPAAGEDAFAALSCGLGADTWHDRLGRRHNPDGPALDAGDYEEWWWHGLLHRIGGPAIVDQTYSRTEWWVRGRRHRLGAPAVEFAGRPHRAQYWVRGVLQAGPAAARRQPPRACAAGRFATVE